MSATDNKLRLTRGLLSLDGGLIRSKSQSLRKMKDIKLVAGNLIYILIEINRTCILNTVIQALLCRNTKLFKITKPNYITFN